MDASVPVLSRNEALDRLEGDTELWGEIRDIWLEDIDALIQAVVKARESQSADGLRRAAHALKGASANVGATRVAAISKRIELLALAANWEELTQLVTTLQSEVEEAKDQLARA